MFVTNDTMPNFLFRNRGDGTFEEVGVAAGVAYNEDGKPLSFMGADFRDYDNDGRDDLLTTAHDERNPSSFSKHGRAVRGHDLSQRNRQGEFPWTGWSTGLFDFNNDGWKDIFTANGHVMDNAELHFRTTVSPAEPGVHQSRRQIREPKHLPERRSIAARRSETFPRWLRGSGGHAAEPGAARCFVTGVREIGLSCGSKG